MEQAKEGSELVSATGATTWIKFATLEGRRSMQLSYAPILGYSFDSTKVAKPIRQPIRPESWSTLEQLERAERRNRRQK